MNGITNEGRIEYTAIKGFKAVRRENGSYSIYVTIKDAEDKLSIHSLLTTNGDHLLDAWNGIRSLAKFLTRDDYFMTI